MPFILFFMSNSLMFAPFLGSLNVILGTKKCSVASLANIRTISNHFYHPAPKKKKNVVAWTRALGRIIGVNEPS